MKMVVHVTLYTPDTNANVKFCEYTFSSLMYWLFIYASKYNFSRTPIEQLSKNCLSHTHTHTHTHTEKPLIFRFFGKHCENVLPAGNIMHGDATAEKPSGKGTDKASINVSSFI